MGGEFSKNVESDKPYLGILKERTAYKTIVFV